MSRVGMAASLLREGKTPEHVARTLRLDVIQVQSIAREVEAAKAKAAPPPPAPKKYLRTKHAKVIRERIAKLPDAPQKAFKNWDRDQDRVLERLCKEMDSYDEVAREMRRSKSAVYQRARALGIPAPNRLVSAMFKASQALRSGDTLTALHLLEAALGVRA